MIPRRLPGLPAASTERSAGRMDWGASLDALAGAFLAESRRHLAELEQHLAELERGHNVAARQGFHKAAHTIAGTAGFFDCPNLAAVTRAAEMLLLSLPEVEPLDSSVLTALRDVVGAVREILSRVAGSGGEGEEDYGVLLAALGHLTRCPASSSP